jgi:hypothetical protein
LTELVARVPPATVWRVHADPEALPRRVEEAGPNRYDDPRPHASNRYVVRYTASTLRGCLLETMAWLRPNDEAEQRMHDIVGDGEDAVGQPAQGIDDYLATRRVAAVTFSDDPSFVDIHHPMTLQVLDTDLNVQPLLDSSRGREVLGERGRTSRPHLDQAAVLLASEFGRQVTQHCSLAIWDQGGRAGVAYRSRHDLTEWCWAAYDHAEVGFGTVESLSPDVPEHREAVSSVVQLWGLATHRWS